MRANPLLCAALAALGLPAAAGSFRTDVNIATAIDMSDSVTAYEARSQLAGLAAALRSPPFVAAVRRGAHGRVGFIVFAWFQGQFPVIAAWRTIGSESDARAVAAELEAFDTRTLDAGWGRRAYYSGRLTDLSGAIDHGRDVLDAAPFASGRGVLNVIGNGADNFGEDVDPAHARIVDAGFTVNAVVTDDDPALVSYYRERVAGGWGAFVLAADPGIDFVTTMECKLTWDIAAER
jgi:hypothetical protein